MPTPNSGLIGVSLSTVDTSPQFKLGTQTHTDSGARFEYVQATADIAQYAAVVIGSSGQATEATTTLAATIKKVGFAQVAITSGQYGWVAREGDNIRCKLAANCAAGAQLYTTATGGVLDDAIVSQGAVHGAVCLVSISTATNTTILAASPHVGYGSGN
jgi:hypothetical protein